MHEMLVELAAALSAEQRAILGQAMQRHKGRRGKPGRDRPEPSSTAPAP
jgi:uncharacterized membrane protein